MNIFLRPGRHVISIAVSAFALLLLLVPRGALAQSHRLITWMEIEGPMSTRAAQGYLGIDFSDVTPAMAQELKLKDDHGAVISLIDHDAPAGQIGLKVNDVVLQMNGQPIQGAEQLRGMLKALSPGSKVSLEISRDGAVQTVNAKLVDRESMERRIWNRLTSFGDVPQMGLFSGGSMPSGFHLPSFGSTLKVGALVEPLTSQMAAYLGVPSGLMVKQVAHKSVAETAGFRAFDVILKVGDNSIATSADWERVLRSSQGQSVPVEILRDKKPQTLTLDLLSKHNAN